VKPWHGLIVLPRTLVWIKKEKNPTKVPANRSTLNPTPRYTYWHVHLFFFVCVFDCLFVFTRGN